MNRTALMALLVAVVAAGPARSGPESTPQQVFERRILPIFKSPERRVASSAISPAWTSRTTSSLA
jgi:hypothetical protein